MRHTLGHALRDVHVAQRELILDHLSHARRRLLRLLRLADVRPHLRLQLLDERRVRLLAPVFTPHRHLTARSRPRRRRREFAARMIRRPVREHHRPVAPLSIHPARQLRRDLPRPARPSRRHARRARFIPISLPRDPSRRRRAPARRRADARAQRVDVQRLHPRLIPRDVRLSRAFERRESIVRSIVVRARVVVVARHRLGLHRVAARRFRIVPRRVARRRVRVDVAQDRARRVATRSRHRSIASRTRRATTTRARDFDASARRARRARVGARRATR